MKLQQPLLDVRDPSLDAITHQPEQQGTLQEVCTEKGECHRRGDSVFHKHVTPHTLHTF